MAQCLLDICRQPVEFEEDTSHLHYTRRGGRVSVSFMGNNYTIKPVKLVILRPVYYSGYRDRLLQLLIQDTEKISGAFEY